MPGRAKPHYSIGIILNKIASGGVVMMVIIRLLYPYMPFQGCTTELIEEAVLPQELS